MLPPPPPVHAHKASTDIVEMDRKPFEFMRVHAKSASGIVMWRRESRMLRHLTLEQRRAQDKVQDR